MNTSLNKWLNRIEQAHPQEIELGLDRVQTVWSALAPNEFPTVVTVAGTNGKGTTCALIEALARGHALQTGLYTSPHFLRYNERVTINGQHVTDEQLVESFERVDAARKGIPLTYFEFGTLAALDVFARSALDLWILEVGLGGRLDAVNIIDADIAAITSIGIDHTDWLGDTREQIGFEKAGIARAGRPLVCGEQDRPSSVDTFLKEIQSPLYQIGVDYGYEFIRAQPNHASKLRFYGQSQGGQPWHLDQLKTGSLLPQNIATALQVCWLSGMEINRVLAREVIEGLKLPGRQQTLSESPEIILDVAHNPQAAQELAGKLETKQVTGERYALVGMLADKDIRKTLSPLLPHIDKWWVVGLDGCTPRGLPAERLATSLKGLGACIEDVSDSVESSFARLRAKLDDQDLAVVLGSFYTVAPLLSSQLMT